MGGCFKVGVVGIGGFAGAHHSALRELEATGLLKVVATCDPAAKELDERRRRYRFEERNVAVFESFDAMLEEHEAELDWISVVSPIRFHAIHHQACVARGIACYLEKPPTLDPAELQKMLGIESTARSMTQVGFNYISQPWRQILKMRLVRGDFGRLQKVAFKGLWRRSREYYERNSWAGRIFLGDYLLLDSCCGNAMSHFLHNFLFHAGTREIMSWARPPGRRRALSGESCRRTRYCTCSGHSGERCRLPSGRYTCLRNQTRLHRDSGMRICSHRNSGRRLGKNIPSEQTRGNFRGFFRVRERQSQLVL